MSWASTELTQDYLPADAPPSQERKDLIQSTEREYACASAVFDLASNEGGGSGAANSASWPHMADKGVQPWRVDGDEADGDEAAAAGTGDRGRPV